MEFSCKCIGGIVLVNRQLVSKYKMHHLRQFALLQHFKYSAVQTFARNLNRSRHAFGGDSDLSQISMRFFERKARLPCVQRGEFGNRGEGGKGEGTMPEQKSEEGEGTKDFSSVPHQKAKIERREREREGGREDKGSQGLLYTPLPKGGIHRDGHLRDGINEAVLGR